MERLGVNERSVHIPKYCANHGHSQASFDKRILAE